jgi:hypothetical protein
MADKKYVQKTIQIPNGSRYSREEKIAIANEILIYIRERSLKGKDKDESDFPTYSKEYMNSLDFKNVKTGKKPNLTLSGDMLAAMDIIAVEGSKVTIGYNEGDPEADRAEGNIRGTYGQSRGSKDKARNFLGIRPDILKALVDKNFPLSNEKKREKNTKTNIESMDEAGLLDEDLLEE